jgi:hypothetical protein
MNRVLGLILLAIFFCAQGFCATAAKTVYDVVELTVPADDDRVFITDVSAVYGQQTKYIKKSVLTAESDPIFSVSDVAKVTSTDISNWDSAYGWGNHASAGYYDSLSDIQSAVTNDFHNLGGTDLVNDADYDPANELPVAGNDIDVSTATVSIEPQLDYVTTINRATDGDLTLSTSADGDNIILSPMGNVGIGTSTASTKLTVNGVVTATGGTSTDWNAKQSALTNSAGLASALSDEVGTGYAVFNASPNFSGNVAIGTTSTSKPLKVIGEIESDSLTVESNIVDFGDVTDGYVLTFDTGTNTWSGAEIVGGGTIDGSGTQYMLATWDDTDTLTDSIIYDNGTNVGIGTTTTTAVLTVDGGVAIGGSGNCGIGTTIMPYNLTVSGTIGASTSITINSCTLVEDADATCDSGTKLGENNSRALCMTCA